MSYLLGVDVGTNSVRVGLFNSTGALIDHHTKEINVFNYRLDFYEQSSNEIWASIIYCIRHIINKNCIHKNLLKIEEISSIGFDATCSLVVLDKNFDPVSVSPSNDDSINVIMWMDHRSKEEAEFINNTKHISLKNVGGTISPEMDPPKILWLKKNMYERCYKKAEYFFSLPDYLVWKSTGVDLRSVCSVTCKWLYQSNTNLKQWDKTFWEVIGLSELCEENFKKIGSKIEIPFKYCQELVINNDMILNTDLCSSVRVGVSMIDAHAGGIGGLALTLSYLETNKNFFVDKKIQIEEVLVLVSGTSSCFMASSTKEKFIDGIWGPYYEAMVPGMWLTEAGQSASGKLIDHLIHNHPAYNELNEKTRKENFSSIYDTLESILNDLANENGLQFESMSQLTSNLHIYPDFHGNRSPLADPRLLGSISGLNFDTSLENLAIIYLATVQSLIYQTKHIINVMNSNGINFRIITIIGGWSNNRLYCQLLSDICHIPVIIPEKGDSIILLGSAILGASNTPKFRESSFDELLKCFTDSNSGTRLLDPNFVLKNYHEMKFKVYLEMVQDQLKYRDIMSMA